MVVGRIARRKLCGSSASTNVVSMPNCANVTRELRIRAAVERARGDDVVAVRAQRQQREHLRRHAGRRGQRRAAAFERGDALLERRDGRIRDARIDVAERLQVEQARGVVGAVEDERRRLVDRQRARAGRRVRDLSGVQAQRVEAESMVRHRRWRRDRRELACGRRRRAVGAAALRRGRRRARSRRC